LTSEKILEVENLLHTTADELLKLKSASEHYDETKECLQKMCESLDKIYLTHQKLTDKLNPVLLEMEKTNMETKKTQELIQSLYDKVNEIKVEMEKNNLEIKITQELIHILVNKVNEIKVEINKQSITLRLTKYLVGVGIVIGVAIIIRIFFF